MLDLWSHKRGFKDQASAIEKDLQVPGAKIVVDAPIGSGRHSIVAALAKKTEIAIVEFPAFADLDAPLHGLVQLTSQAGGSELGTSELLARTQAAAWALADADRAVVVLLPVADVPRSADVIATRQHVEEIIGALLGVAPLRVAIIATPATWRRAPEIKYTHCLDAPKIGPQQIDPDKLEGAFRNAARALVQWMGKHDWASTPLEARLQVGLIALGELPDDVAHRLDGLIVKLVRQLARWPSIGRAVRRLLLARQPLPIAKVAEVSEIEPHWLPLLTSCIGYGDDNVRVPELTRQVLLDNLATNATELESAHAALAQHHKMLDGALDVRSLHVEKAVNWLEKVHHLALGGEGCEAEWLQQEKAGREQLWEHARFLSHERKKFKEAAQIYKSCIGTFGRDPYSEHYLAYNLERAHDLTSDVRNGYAYAVADDAGNPWWQQRWIRYLITDGTLVEAREAWRSAIQAIDPDGSWLRQSPWLALHLHYWVARRWLASGYLRDARDVLSDVPPQWMKQEHELRVLDQLLTTQEEAVAIGESVYPASTPIDKRWRDPRALKLLRAGNKLEQWAPGRVVSASREGVTIVVAPTRDEAQQLSFDRDTWRRIANELPEDAGGFIEFGVYEAGEIVVRSIPDDGDGGLLDAEDADLYDRVATWSPP